MDPRLTMITLGVADLAASRAFYARLGFVESPASQDCIAFFKAGGVVLALFGQKSLADDAQVPFEPPSAFRGVTLAHNVDSREKVAQVLEQAAQAGAHVVKPAQDVFWGGHSGYFADPDGHLWEVAYNPFSPLDEQGQMILP